MGNNLFFKIEKLNKSFKTDFLKKPRHVLKDLSFEVRAGVTTGFIGINGSGKTTTLKCLFGFIHPDSGSITFSDGQSLNADVKSKIGYLPERPYYYEFLSAEEFLHFHWQLAGLQGDFESVCDQTLAKVKLKEAKRRPLRNFSKGMLQRIGLAQAVLAKPQGLILDEPMSGLDPDGRILIKQILREEKEKGTTIFFSSHLLSDMEELCERAVVIHDGRLVYQGPLDEFRQGRSVEQSFKELREKLSKGDYQEGT